MKGFNSIFNIKNKDRLLVYSVLAVLALLVVMQSPLAPGGKGVTQYDSGVYLYTGWRMKLGNAPYLQAWDNKGPVLYFINMIGIALSYRYGVWFMELIFMFVAGCFCYRALRLFSRRAVALASTVFVLLILPSVFQGGNLTEEWALPFCFISLYIFSCYSFQDYSFKGNQVLVLGACFGAAAFLRTNLVVIWAAFCFVLFLDTLLRKRFTLALKYIGFFIMGCGAIVLPFILYLASKGALKDFVFAVYKSSMSFKEKSFIERIAVAKDILGNMDNSHVTLVIAVFILAALYMIFSKRIKNRRDILMISSSTLALLLNIYANTISGYSYGHYSMSFLPVLAYPVMLLFGLTDSAAKRAAGGRKLPAFALMVFMVLFLSWNNVLELPKNIVRNLTGYKGSAVVKYIKSNSTEQDRISIIGPPMFYYSSRREAASSVFYVLAGDAFNNEVKKQVDEKCFEETMANKPELVLVFPGTLDLLEEDRDLIGNFNGFKSFLQYGYKMEGRLEGWDIYKKTN